MFLFNVYVFENVLIPANAECVVSMRTNARMCFKDRIFSPFKEKLSSLSIVAAQSIVRSVDGFVPIRLCNIGNEDRILYKNTVVGTIEPCDDVEKITNEGFVNAISEKKANDFDTLISRINKNDNLKIHEKEQAVNLLSKFQNVFASENLLMDIAMQ